MKSQTKTTSGSISGTMRRYLKEFVLLVFMMEGARGFLSPILNTEHSHKISVLPPTPKFRNEGARTSSALNVWWFGGTDMEQSTLQETGDDSCELVAVRIERPTSNSRKIFGEITVPVPIEDVWAILTDYDRLSIHVPNLVESKVVQRNSGGEPGDGEFRCRLFQKGAQKIVGFSFGASVTMDMVETSSEVIRQLPDSVNGSPAPVNGEAVPPAVNGKAQSRERKIGFRCVDSFFFDAFDGEWHVSERMGENGQPESVLAYIVYVRPKGPVPVGALEWRIREDVPTNLRAVKKAALEVGYQGVMASRTPRSLAPGAAARTTQRNGQTQPVLAKNADRPARRRMERVFVQWEESETMAAYLGNQ